jgi:hypothetical protein
MKLWLIAVPVTVVTLGIFAFTQLSGDYFTADVPIAVGTPTNESLQHSSKGKDDAVESMRQQVSLLTAQLNQLSSQMQALQSAPAADAKKGQQSDEVVSAEKARMEAIQKISAIDNTFLKEKTDPVWSRNVEYRLQNAFTKQDLTGHSVVNMECHSSLCKLVVAHDPNADVATFHTKLRDQISDVLTAGAIRPGNNGESIVYLAKDTSALL